MENYKLVALLLLISFIGLAITIYQYSPIEARLEKLALHTEEQKLKVVKNERALKAILLQLVEIKKNIQSSVQNNKSIPEKIIVNSEAEQLVGGLEFKLSALNKRLDQFTQNTNKSLEGIRRELSTNNGEVSNSPIKAPLTKEEIDRIAKEQLLQTEAVFEEVFDNDVEDINWTTSIEEKLDALVVNKRLGASSQIQNVKCHYSLCKVTLTHKEGDLDMQQLAISIGSFAAIKKDSAISGQNETVLFIAPPGQRLPEVNYNQQ